MKFSILTPCYNSGKYLGAAIESAIKQDYQNWEHIVIDGGSTDASLEILERYPHVIWESGPDKGQSDAMNKAFSKATGDIIIYLNADDELNQGLLSFLAREFAKYPNCDMMVGNLTVKSNNGLKIKEPSTSLSSILHFRRFSFPLNPISYAYKRSLQKKIGLFPIDNHYTMDYWFLLRAYLKGHVKKHDFNCGVYHLETSNKSSNKFESIKSLTSVQKTFIKSHLHHPAVWKYLLTRCMGKIKKYVSV